MNPPTPADSAVAIGIDIGATTTRVGLVTSDVRVLEHDQSPCGSLDKPTAVRAAPEPQASAYAVPQPPTYAQGTSTDVLARRMVATPDSEAPMGPWLTTAIDELYAQHEASPVVAVGLAVPGLVETDTGRVTRCVRLPYLEGDWLTQSLSDHTGLPVVLATDMDAAALSEWLMLASAPPRFAHLRLGTGVGLGVIEDGKPLPVEPGRSTHASVLVVDEQTDTARCACGLRGCLEMIASGCALAKTARSLGFHGLPELQQACDRQEPEARAVVEAAAKAMTRAVVNIHRRYQPEVVAVGGGVTEHLPALYERTAELFSQYHLSEHVPHGTIPSARALRVDRALLGDDAGVIGAAQLATAHHGMP